MLGESDIEIEVEDTKAMLLDAYMEEVKALLPFYDDNIVKTLREFKAMKLKELNDMIDQKYMKNWKKIQKQIRNYIVKTGVTDYDKR